MSTRLGQFLDDPPNSDERLTFEPIVNHGHQDLVQAIAFNAYGDRCATGSVDGKIRVFNRHKDGVWRHCDNWTAHSSEITELQWLPPTIYPNLLASLGMEGRFKLWAEDPQAAPGRRFSSAQPRNPFWINNTNNNNSASHTPSSSTPTAGGTAGGGGITPSRPGTSTPGGSIERSTIPLGGLPGPTPPPGPHQSNLQTLSEKQAHSASSQLHPPAPPASEAGSVPSTATAGAGGPGGPSSTPKAAFETRNARSPYRSFSMKHIDETRHTYLALLSSDGRLTVYENEQPENLTDYNQIDDLVVSRITPPCSRGEESSFKVMFDPNLEVCYTALRAGVPQDALGLVTVAMDCVRVWRSRDVITQNLGVVSVAKGFYLAAEVPLGVHRGLVRDVAWAGGNVRGYDVIATAGGDGWVRVFRLDTPLEEAREAYKRRSRREEDEDGGEEDEEDEGGMTMKGRKSRDKDKEKGGGEERKGWTSGEVRRHAVGFGGSKKGSEKGGGGDKGGREDGKSGGMTSGIRVGLQGDHYARDRRQGGGQVRHRIEEISRMNNHKTPVWRVGFDDDGQVLGSVGDEGRLMHYRQMPDGGWAKSSELAMIKLKMAAP